MLRWGHPPWSKLRGAATAAARQPRPHRLVYWWRLLRSHRNIWYRGLGSRRPVRGRRRGGGEDPWLCGPGFGRVCPYRGMRWISDTLRSGTGVVKTVVPIDPTAPRPAPDCYRPPPEATVEDGGVRRVGIAPINRA